MTDWGYHTAKRKQWRETIDPNTVPKFIIKKCKICSKVARHDWNSSFYYSGTPEYKGKCRKCQNKYGAKYQAKNAKLIAIWAMERKWRRKEKCIQYMGGKCNKCSYSKSLRALTFHHKNRSEKEFSVSVIMDWSWEKIKKELGKCELICFNCHMGLEEKMDRERRKCLLKKLSTAGGSPLKSGRKTSISPR